MMASGEIRLSTMTMRQMPVLAQSQQHTNCVNNIVRVAQGVIGAAQAIAGAVQAIEGAAQFGAGILGAPETGGASLLVVPGGAANAIYGSAAVIDGGLLIQAAFNGSGDPSTTFGLIGQQYGGENGQLAGETANIGGLAGIATISNSAARTANFALAVAGQIAGTASAICGQ